MYKNYLGKISLHALFGCFFGLIPQLGTTLSSYISYIIEKFRKKSALDRIIASETANNSAAITGWIPLILFGIPIYASEIMLVNYFQKYNLNFDFLKEKNIFLIIAISSILSAVIYFIIATFINQKYYNTISKIIFHRSVGVFLILISLGFFYFTNQYDLKYLLYHCMFFFPISYAIYHYKVDLFTLVIGLLITDDIVYTTIRVWQIYN
jgi:putative tricarboxylic transport membrane protein